MRAFCAFRGFGRILSLNVAWSVSGHGVITVVLPYFKIRSRSEFSTPAIIVRECVCGHGPRDQASKTAHRLKYARTHTRSLQLLSEAHRAYLKLLFWRLAGEDGLLQAGFGDEPVDELDEGVEADDVEAIGNEV